MKKTMAWFLIVLSFFLLLMGCGPKGVDDVVSDLNNRAEKMTGYKMKAVLTLQTGKEPQSYNVEVWHNKPDFYRVALTSEERDITQIILRNEEGVFVLTPHLNKSFRFQSGWPENHGQVYLYESLIRSVVNDEARVFAEEGEKYVFEVKADYQNRSLTTQKIWFAKDLAPLKVEIMDTNKNVMVSVDVSSFEVDSKFDDDSFDKDRNMETSMLMNSLPTIAQPENNQQLASSFGVIQPSYVPEGVSLAGVDQVKGENGPKVVLRYKGEYNFNLIEERPLASAVSYPSGEIVDLGHAIGIMTGDQKRTLTWTYQGIEYLLTGDLTEEELIAVAKSTFNQVGK